LEVGAKQAGEKNHVEAFAMIFVEKNLSAELSDFVAKNRPQVGYDREAKRRSDGALVRLKIKGQRPDQPVKLICKEPEAAQAAARNGEQFRLCVVPRVPEEAQLWVVENVMKVGSFETMTIVDSNWKTHGRRAV